MWYTAAEFNANYFVSGKGDFAVDILYIVMPAYNEEENLADVIKEWYPIVDKHSGGGKSRLIVINDGSRDRTLEIGRSMQENRPLLEVFDKENSGHGMTVMYGYRYALERGADFIFQTDSDGQTRPAEFESFWQIRHQYQAVIGYRNHRQDGLSRIIVTKVLKLVLLLIFGLNITDANTPFRLMKRDLLLKHLQNVPKDFNLPNVLLSVLFHYNGEKICYIPITFRPRQGGINSINIKRIIGIGWRAIKDFYFIHKNMCRH